MLRRQHLPEGMLRLTHMPDKHFCPQRTLSEGVRPMVLNLFPPQHTWGRRKSLINTTSPGSSDSEFWRQIRKGEGAGKALWVIGIHLPPTPVSFKRQLLLMLGDKLE